mgnify:CR=1 FL=1
MKFTELIELADLVAAQIKEGICIGVSYWNFTSGTRELKYSFYCEHSLGTTYFNTVQDLRAHMESMLKSITDEGIDINDKWPMTDEDGTIRGAE